jgi:hypothetical protein
VLQFLVMRIISGLRRYWLWSSSFFPYQLFDLFSWRFWVLLLLITMRAGGLWR